MKSATWADLAFGVWLVASPSVIGYAASRPAAVAEDLVPGVFLCLASLWVVVIKIGRLETTWLEALCGLWLLVGSVVLTFSGLPRAALNSLIVGLLVLAVNVIGMSRLVRQS
jgi:hypothetical protein